MMQSMQKIVYRFHCESCGRDFDRPRQVEESRGEFWGAPCSETMYYCPHCGDDCFYENELTEADRVALAQRDAEEEARQRAEWEAEEAYILEMMNWEN